MSTVAFPVFGLYGKHLFGRVSLKTQHFLSMNLSAVFNGSARERGPPGQGGPGHGSFGLHSKAEDWGGSFLFKSRRQGGEVSCLVNVGHVGPL